VTSYRLSTALVSGLLVSIEGCGWSDTSTCLLSFVCVCVCVCDQVVLWIDAYPCTP